MPALYRSAPALRRAVLGCTISDMAESAPSPRVCSDIHDGDRGSRVLAVTSDDAQALQRLVESLGSGFRKVWFDLAGGFAEFMSPSQAHEFTARDARDLVMALCHARGIDVVDMGATTIQTPDGAKAGDPDESFLVGKRATAYREIEAAEGNRAAGSFVEGQSPDLAIEVEHTHRQPEKVNIYRECGVAELWNLATEEVGCGPVVYDLQAEDRPQAIARSRLLPGVCAEALPAAAADLRRMGGPLRFAERMACGERVDQQLLKIAGISQDSMGGGPPAP